MSTPRATIIDIAEAVGLSKSTVANVLSGTGRFSPATSARVHAAAAKLGYVTNRAARSLRSGRVGSYGIHLPTVARRLPFYTEFALGAADGADAAQADLTLFTSEIDPARSFAVDGAMVVDPEPDAAIVVALARAGIPILSVGAYHGVGEADVAATLDARHDALQREALDLLRARGRRRFVLLSLRRELGSAWTESTERTFHAWCAETGSAGEVLDVSADPARWASDERLAGIVAGDRTDAIVCAGQGTAHASRIILEASGIRIGQDIDLASFAAAPDELLDPRLTVIDLAPTAYGRRAAELLTAIIAGDPDAHRHHWFDGARVRAGV
ncbi:MAG TPA: LacI family DNA-binding transcriptional regulator [Microbacterium sp.]|uniref:LacI family DNA-binding transcriptional regulator n=1 Tax=Microbacterium sp. TaxID=51671 RepID=UPI002B49FFF9|nr:LacI family DNA-binding transcriptional regulator [Microbacterium sp.]HKT56901.1 LacI family DNA-binding transcriptional regulator [Microbacterium sp.]